MRFGKLGVLYVANPQTIIALSAQPEDGDDGRAVAAAAAS
jgi:hypothetical protein